MSDPRQSEVRRSIVRRLVVQACLLTTFVIVALSTAGFILAKSALNDVAQMTGIPAADGDRAMEPGLTMLANSFTIIGVLLVGFAAATAFLLAKQVTNPLRALVAKVGALRPGDRSKRTVKTGDEVEVLDDAVVNMTDRLATVYAHQEEEITKRTADLRKQYQLDRAILDSIHLGVITIDLTGTVILSNPAAHTLLQSEAIEGKNIQDVLLLRGHGGAHIPGEHTVLQCLRQGGTFRTPPSSHWSLELPDKGLLPITLSVVPLKDGERSFGALVMFQNVSEERHIDYLKSEFITLASHQLRTPLSSIRWYAELLADSRENLQDEQKEYVEEIDNSVRRMITLLGALLNAARIEDETVRPTLTYLTLAPLIEEVLRESDVLFEGSGIQPKVVLPPPDVSMRTDPVLLKVVLQNLLSNAVKYSPKGSVVTIRLAVKDGSAVISIEDKGMGVPLSDQERIFEKFFRAQNVRQVDTDGNGLGLYISKSIIDRLGGTLGFVSTAGKGTTFTVTLPITEQA